MSVESDPHTRPSSANRTHPAEAMDAVRKALLDARREIRGFLVRRLKERTAAEDVLQQFSLRALERSSELRDVKSVRGWLSRILSSVIADYQRSEVRRRNMKAAVRQSTLSDEEFEPEPEIDSAVCQCLHHLMPTLRPSYADILSRIDLAGETRQRVAQSLGTSPSNVTVRLHRARQALRKRLEQFCTTCPEHGYQDCACQEMRVLRERAART
ncbi:MAG: RNA polymerase subunit sigma-70 [Novosphingobium sp.]|nr:RNA polymerase subunit sigma-70 [Novosphingobium sp.]